MIDGVPRYGFELFDVVTLTVLLPYRVSFLRYIQAIIIRGKRVVETIRSQDFDDERGYCGI